MDHPKSILYPTQVISLSFHFGFVSDSAGEDEGDSEIRVELEKTDTESLGRTDVAPSMSRYSVKLIHNERMERRTDRTPAANKKCLDLVSEAMLLGMDLNETS